MTTSTRAKTTTKSGKTRRAPRETKNPPTPGDDDDEEGGEAADEGQHEGDAVGKPPGSVMQQQLDPITTYDEVVMRSKNTDTNEASRGERSPAILPAEQPRDGRVSENHPTSTPAMDAEAVIAVLQQLTAIAAGMQPRATIAMEDGESTSNARSLENQAARVPARVTPAVMADSLET
ncbi:hypothetical protein PR003_g8551 [Phytophthora rubi]|uniref:Uncharacterized protein n=1 Tax=Phytophthora rubi TaxID=129364 RepID=A0A6A3MV02_9STRA|nr:hypothetical protein PR001_g10261 [Phytophthora rubi]KAE9033725.1 hypothetical protein PR002_g8523 [Phytophthora rubi]KAE9344276.1 hypothetical protein PR003_g8551 [Phytophthora rubi]